MYTLYFFIYLNKFSSLSLIIKAYLVFHILKSTTAVLEKKKLKNRRLFISILIIVALLSLTTVIIYQYNQYNQVEKRLNKAYSSRNLQSSALYKLFSTFSEADYLFRMYAINFNEEEYIAYSQKLDTIKVIVDSLASLPITNNPIKQLKSDDQILASEYLLLIKQVDHLIFYAKDTISTIIDQNEPIKKKSNLNLLNPDAVIKSILSDTSLQSVTKDTVVKKKENLFKRVFKAKDDTIFNKNVHEVINSNQIDIVLKKNIDMLMSNNKKVYTNDLNQLKSTFEKLKTKERQLLFANFTLLNNLKHGIDRLRQLEFDTYKKNQEADFSLYRNNSKSIRTQLILALAIMLLMVVLVIGYQRQVFFYERKLIKEKKYADIVAEEKTSVLANISHEIRTPLNSLKGLVNILKNNSADNCVDQEIIDSVDHDITVINSTINDILSLSKLESESLMIKNEQINIYNLIEDLINLHVYHATNKGLELNNNNTLTNNMLINSNPFRIKQVISNLITNAIKYTDKGYVTINSSLTNNKSTLIIKVEDSGIGISKEQSDQVFRKYYVADNKSKAGGFGLGLYISKILSEQIGGSLSLISTLNKGTTFTFELPVSFIENIDTDKEPLHTIGEIPTDLKIVVIDDSKINLFFIQQLFKERKNTAFFMDPRQALDYIKNNAVDIVITDLKMPKISGWEVLNTIKADAALQQIKVFAATAEPLLLEYDNGNNQFDGIVNKPIKENELVQNILNT